MDTIFFVHAVEDPRWPGSQFTRLEGMVSFSRSVAEIHLPATEVVGDKVRRWVVYVPWANVVSVQHTTLDEERYGDEVVR